MRLIRNSVACVRMILICIWSGLTSQDQLEWSFWSGLTSQERLEWPFWSGLTSQERPERNGTGTNRERNENKPGTERERRNGPGTDREQTGNISKKLMSAKLTLVQN